MQEGEASERHEQVIEHKNSISERFVVNLHALHNAHLIRKVLPRALTAIVPLYADRRAAHVEQAEVLRKHNNAKRKVAEENRLKKKEAEAAKHSGNGGDLQHQPREDEEEDAAERLPDSDEEASAEAHGYNDDTRPRKRRRI